MGLLDWLKQPSTSGSGGLFNQANQHWKLRQIFILDERRRLQETAEVVRYCQQAISANRKEGDAYVLLTNALVAAIYDKLDNEKACDLLRKYAAGAIHKWQTKPQPEKAYPFTRHPEHGVYFYERVATLLQKAEGCSKEEAEAKIAEYGARYGDLAISPQSFERIREAIL